MLSSTASGRGVPYLSITSAPASCQSHSICAPAASSTCRAASTSEGPTPSPGISVTLLFAISAFLGILPPRLLEGQPAVLSHVLDEAAFREYVKHNTRQRRRFDLASLGHVRDGALCQVHFQGVAVIDPRGVADQGGQPVVYGVAEVDARERHGEHRRHARVFQRQGRLLPRRATAEVLARDDEVALLEALHEVRVEVLHHVAGELIHVERLELVTARYDVVCVYVVAEPVRLAFHIFPVSLFFIALPPYSPLPL